MTITGTSPMSNINSKLKINHFIPQQIVDESTALSSKPFWCMYLCFKKDLTNNPCLDLLVNLPRTLLKNFGYGD